MRVVFRFFLVLIFVFDILIPFLFNWFWLWGHWWWYVLAGKALVLIVAWFLGPRLMQRANQRKDIRKQQLRQERLDSMLESNRVLVGEVNDFGRRLKDLSRKIAAMERAVEKRER